MLKAPVGAGNGENLHWSPGHPVQVKLLGVPQCVQPMLGTPQEACLGSVAQRWMRASPWDMTCEEESVQVTGG